MLWAGHGGAAAALRQEPGMLLGPMVEAVGSHPAAHHVTPAPGAVPGDEGPLVHGEGAVVSGEVQREVVGREAILQVVEGGVRVLEACRGGWVSGGKIRAAGHSQRAQGRRLSSKQRRSIEVEGERSEGHSQRAKGEVVE